MKLTLLIILYFSFYHISAQSVVGNDSTKIIGECNEGTTRLAQLVYVSDSTDTIYTFTMKNRSIINSEPECSISFSGNTTVVNQFYNTLKRIMHMRSKKRRDYTATVILSGKLVVLTASTIMGTDCVKIYLPQGNNVLTDWQIDKVFGKS